MSVLSGEWWVECIEGWVRCIEGWVVSGMYWGVSEVYWGVSELPDIPQWVGKDRDKACRVDSLLIAAAPPPINKEVWKPTLPLPVIAGSRTGDLLTKFDWFLLLILILPPGSPGGPLGEKTWVSEAVSQSVSQSVSQLISEWGSQSVSQWAS